MAKRRVARTAMAVAIATSGVVGVFASPAWAPRITKTGPAGVTMEDCRGGGWEGLGFKNQGQCMAWANQLR